jgi:hypothetical protein
LTGLLPPVMFAATTFGRRCSLDCNRQRRGCRALVSAPDVKPWQGGNGNKRTLLAGPFAPLDRRGKASFSLSLSLSPAFLFRFWGSPEELEWLNDSATTSNFLRPFESSPCKGMGGPSKRCWSRPGMKTRKSFASSGASLKRVAICRETSACNVKFWLPRGLAEAG